MPSLTPGHGVAVVIVVYGVFDGVRGVSAERSLAGDAELREAGHTQVGHSAGNPELTRPVNAGLRADLETVSAGKSCAKFVNQVRCDDPGVSRAEQSLRKVRAGLTRTNSLEIGAQSGIYWAGQF